MAEAGFDPERPDTMSADELGLGDDGLVVAADGSLSGKYFGATFDGSWAVDGDAMTVTRGSASPVVYTLDSEGRELQRMDHDGEHGLDMVVSYDRAEP